MQEIDEYKQVDILEFKNIAYFEYSEKTTYKIKIPDAMLKFLHLKHRSILYPIIRRNKETGLLTIFLNTDQHTAFKNNPVHIVESGKLAIKNNDIVNINTYRTYEISIIYYQGINAYSLKLQELKEIYTKEK